MAIFRLGLLDVASSEVPVSYRSKDQRTIIKNPPYLGHDIKTWKLEINIVILIWIDLESTVSSNLQPGVLNPADLAQVV